MLEKLAKSKIMLNVNKIMWHGVWTMNHYVHILISTKLTLICVYDNELIYFELILNLDFKLATHVIVDFNDFGPIIILNKVKYFKHILVHNTNLMSL
jgi:hypothetical protein